MGGMDHFGWGMGFGGVFMLFLWVLVILGIVALVKWLMTSSKGEVSENPPLEILKERYAQGEIDREEFEQKKHHLVDE